MLENALVVPVELIDAELDAVTGGALATGGLVNITLNDTNINILTNHGIDVNVQTLRSRTLRTTTI